MNASTRVVTWWVMMLTTMLTSTTVRAQQDFQIEFGSSPNPVGSGARALGTASAFIATADDATAASWNPAALIVLEGTEFSIVESTKIRSERFVGPGVAEGDEIQRLTSPGLNYLSAAHPFKLDGRYFVASFNFQSLIDFNKRVKKTLFLNGETLRGEAEVDFLQRGVLTAFSPALAFQVLPELALGAALNISTDKLGYRNGWTQREKIGQRLVFGANTIASNLLVREEYGFNGFSANAGVLWDITPRYTLGAVLKTPMWGSLNRSVKEFSENGAPIIEPGSDFSEPIRFPPSYGVGLAYRHSDEFTASVDLYRTEWSLFRHDKTNLRTGEKSATNPISSEPYSEAHVSGITQAHLGGEYLFILPRTVIAARGGVFYDPEPSSGGANHFFGLAVGTGVSLGSFVVDVAYQLRGSSDANNDIGQPNSDNSTAVVSARGGAVVQHLFYISTIYYL